MIRQGKLRIEVLTLAQRALKLQALALLEGHVNPSNLIADNLGELAVGMCFNEGCQNTSQVYPAQQDGYCDCCLTNTVASCLVLAQVI